MIVWYMAVFTKDGVKEHQPCLMSPTPFCFVFSLY